MKYIIIEISKPAAITTALNGEEAIALLTTGLKKSWMYQVWHLLSVAALHRSRIKFIISDFNGVSIINFVPDWVSEIVNLPDLQTNSSKD